MQWAIRKEFGSAAQLSKRPGSVWNCLWENALKRSPGIIRKSRVSYPVPGFLSSATWPSLPKKHYNGLDQTYTHTNIHTTYIHTYMHAHIHLKIAKHTQYTCVYRKFNSSTVRYDKHDRS